MVKVLFITENFLPNKGGVEFHILNLSKYLLKSGFEIYVVTKKKDLSIYEQIDGINIHRINNVLSFQQLMKKINPDIVHAHGARSFFVAAAIVMSRIFRKHIVFTPHCFYPAYSIANALKKWMFDHSIGIISIRNVDRIICLTENDKADTIARGGKPNRITIIPNSVIPEDLLSNVPKLNLKNKHNCDRIILFSGRLDKVKGVEHLIEAFSSINILGTKLIIIGKDHGILDALRVKAKLLQCDHNVIFAGEVNFSELKAYYNESDIYCLPSRYEGLPTTVLEAMLFRKIVIVSNRGGMQYMIEDSKEGFIVDYNNPEKLSRVLANTLQHYNSYTELRDNAYKKVMSDYNWNINSNKIISLYQNIHQNN